MDITVFIAVMSLFLVGFYLFRKTRKNTTNTIGGGVAGNDSQNKHNDSEEQAN